MNQAESESIQITTALNGPYVLTGPVIIKDHDDISIPIPPGSFVALCRCGQSANKPFCDGAHARAEFDGTNLASNRATS